MGLPQEDLIPFNQGSGLADLVLVDEGAVFAVQVFGQVLTRCLVKLDP